MTTYIDGPIRCSDDQILCNLYYAGGERRTAQTFVCWFPSGESIDVVNVHAPSGYRPLKDPQRKTLLTTLLQSSSQTRPDASIGNAHFLIGGDMNTTPLRMSQLLQTCRDDGTLRTQARTHQRDSAKHGDLCIVGGIQARILETTAENHDKQHDPYGICWSSMPRRPSAIRPGYATEQSLPADGREEGHQTAKRQVAGGRARRDALEHLSLIHI